jgi:hypothetical protein
MIKQYSTEHVDIEGVKNIYIFNLYFTSDVIYWGTTDQQDYLLN